MGLLLLYYYGCLRLRFPDVETNPGPRSVRPRSCRVMFSNINGLHGNLEELAVAAAGYDVVACAETKVTNRRHLAELRLPGFSSPNLLLRGARPNGLGLSLFVRSGLSVCRMTKFECDCCEFLVSKLCGDRLNVYLIFVYRSPNTDDRVYDCLLSAMGRIQSTDPKSAFCFLGDFNCHHMEWLGSPRTNAHGVAALDFATLSDCTQLVRGPTHRNGGTLDLILSNMPDLCRVTVGCCIGKSDHNFVSLTINLSARVPGFDSAQRVPLKTRVNWARVSAAIADMPWGTICRSATMISDLDVELLRVLNRYVPMVTVRKRFGDAPWFTPDCRVAFEGKQTAYFRWNMSRSAEDWNSFKLAQRAANACYAAAKAQYSVRCREKLVASSSAHAWWTTLKESVFGVSSALPPLQSAGGALVSDPAGKAELLSSWFDSKQSREGVSLPATCHPEPVFCSFAFRSREVERLLKDLDSHGGVDPLGYFPLFFKESAVVLAPKLSRIFRRLLREGQFPPEWRTADITPLPKGPLSSIVSGYRPISITPVLSKVYERLISSRLASFMESSNLFPPHQYSYRKGLGTCDALLDVVCAGQDVLDGGGELALVQIDFSAAFDRVNHIGLLHKLAAAGVGGVILEVIHNFLSNRIQRVKVDGVRSSVVDVVSGVPQGSVLGPLLFLLYTGDLSHALENTLVGYADDSTLVSPVSCVADRVSVSASLNRDLVRISDWCNQWGMQVNPSKTKGMIVSRSCTMLPSFSDLVLNGTVVEMVDELKILGVLLDRKLTFESQVRSLAAAASSRIGILRKTMSVFRDPALVVQCFWSFVLPVLEYCSVAWMSVASTHLQLLDRVVRNASTISGGRIVCDLAHRRRVACMCMCYKILNRNGHPVKSLFPPCYVPARATRMALAAHAWSLQVPRVRTTQHSRSFVPASVRLWNSLDGSCFAGDGLPFFKSAVNRALLD